MIWSRTILDGIVMCVIFNVTVALLFVLSPNAFSKNKKCTLFTDKVQDKKVRESAASWKSSYALDWKFDYVKGADEFYNTYYECGICKLGEKEGCCDFHATRIVK